MNRPSKNFIKLNLRPSQFRKYHRTLSVLVFLPLLLMALTGSVSPILDALHFEQATLLIRRIHSGKIFFGSAYFIYAVPSGFALLGLLVTGANLLKRFKPIPLRTQPKHDEEKVAFNLNDSEMMLILLLLVPNNERKHLLHLASDRTTNYVGSRVLQAELDYLQSLGLIKVKDGQSIDNIEQLTFNLADYVQLTNLGRYWIQSAQKFKEQLF